MSTVKTMLVINSNPNNILKLEHYLSSFVNKVDGFSSRYSDVLISLTEAVNNAIIHGNNRDENKKVEINMKCTTKGVHFSVSDEGKGFNPSALPDPTKPENLECCGGRGVFIMSRLCDKLAFNNNGSAVKMYFGF